MTASLKHALEQYRLIGPSKMDRADLNCIADAASGTVEAASDWTKAEGFGRITIPLAGETAESIANIVADRILAHRHRRLADEWNAGAEAMLNHLKNRIDSYLDAYLSEMKEGYDDSIVGFNEAWDIIRKCFADIYLPRRPA